MAEPGQFFLYFLLRFLTTFAASIIAVIGLAIPFAIVVAIGAVIVIILKTVSTSLAVLLGVPAALLVFVLFLLAGIGVSGSIGTYRRNYALLFYGGRYPPLGNLLQPPAPPPMQQWNPARPQGVTPPISGNWPPGS